MSFDVMQWDGTEWDGIGFWSMRCHAMSLCDVVIWEMMCCELRRANVTAKPSRGPFQCTTSTKNKKFVLQSITEYYFITP